MFDIERDLYAKWNKKFEKLGVKFMVCGHLHRAYVLFDGDERNTLPHKYPVIVGSECHFDKNSLWGTALTIGKKSVKVEFTDENKQVQESCEIKY